MFQTILISVGIWLTLLPQDVPAPAAPEKPKTQPEKKIETKPQATLPFPEGKTVRYRWTLKGQEVGESYFSWQKYKHGGIQVDGRLEYSGMGAQLYVTAKTLLDAEMRPIRLDLFLRGAAAAVNIPGGRRVEVDFQDESAAVKITNLAGGPPIEREREIPVPYAVYANNAFEHFVLLAPQIAASGSTTSIRVFMPGRDEVFSLRFNRQKPAADSGSDGLSRWKFAHTTFAGEVWIDKQGRLKRYQQGETIVEMVE